MVRFHFSVIVLIGFVTSPILLVGCGTALEPTGSPASDGRSTVTFSVDGMMCEESCAKTVKEILAGQPGVEEATVDFDSKTATCSIAPSEFEPAAAIAELADQDFLARVQE